MKAFTAPTTSLGDLDAEAAAMLITAAADVSLIIDRDGVIRDVAFNSTELATEIEGETHWLGQTWLSTVTPDSQAKVEAILRDASAIAPVRWRHVNQIAPRGASVPVLYSALRIGADDRTVVFGRDLRPISALQQRLVEAQQSMERDYSRLRHAETRYRLLFQMSAEPVLVLDGSTDKVVDANPAARRLLGDEPLPGRAAQTLTGIMDGQTASSVQALLATVRSAGRADDVTARLADGGREAVVSASMFRQDGAPMILARISFPYADGNVVSMPTPKSKLLKLIESAPDGFVVTTEDGAVITANAAFLDMAQVGSEEQIKGESLERWVGRPGVDLDVLMTNVRRSGPVRLFVTTLRGDHGAMIEAEISAVSVMNGGRPCFGFAIRDVGARIVATAAKSNPATRSVEQLTELIGRVPLKDLVREATDVIERLCIEAALELTGDNRASAAEMLGLSRQSLYVKLRRYGLGDLAGPDGEQA